MKRQASKSGYEKGKRGLATLIKVDDTKLRVEFEDGTEAHIVVSKETVPELLNVSKMVAGAKVSVDITLDETDARILFVRPSTGSYDLQFVKFWAEKDQPPKMETKKGRGDKPYNQFSAVVEIQKKAGSRVDFWKGARYNVYFFDAFGKDEDGNLTVLSKGDNSDFLNDFLDCIGANSRPIKYSENPLPEIEKIALQEKRTFQGDIRKVRGYANVVMFYNTGNLDDDSAFLGEEENIDNVHPPKTEETKTHPALDE